MCSAFLLSRTSNLQFFKSRDLRWLLLLIFSSAWWVYMKENKEKYGSFSSIITIHEVYHEYLLFTIDSNSICNNCLKR